MELHELMLVALGHLVELQRSIMNLTALPHLTGALELYKGQ